MPRLLGPGATGQPDNPWVYSAVDYLGRQISITVPWNANTRALSNATVFRDPACLAQHIYLGLGPDGTPNSTPFVFLVPAGTTTVTTKQMSSLGLNTIDDVVAAMQITAGP